MTSHSEFEAIAQDLVAKLYTSAELDLFHIAVLNLIDMVRNNEIDLVIAQDDKSDKQKKEFIDKIIESVRSPILQQYLKESFKNEGDGFFREKNMQPFLETLEKATDDCALIKLTVAIDFKDEDLREMAEYLGKRVGKKVILSIQVDHSLIAGAIVQYGSYVSDLSIKTQVDLYRSHWHKAVVEQN